MTGIDDVNAPRSMLNIVLEVMEFVDTHASPEESEQFKTYDDALKVVWPGLFKASPEAAVGVSIAIYLDVADRKGFKVHPSELEEFKF